MIRALIVEDDPMVAMLNAQYIGMLPGYFHAGTASSLKEATAMLSSIAVDLILLDIYLMGVSGLDLLPSVTAEFPETDVIMISAATDSTSISKALRHGAVDYLIKPFTFERFKQALERHQARKRLMDGNLSVTQQQLDQWIKFAASTESGASPGSSTASTSSFHDGLTVEVLPKGLAPLTLDLVKDGIGETNGQWFSTQELADRISISRISTRKYLDHLAKMGQLETRQQYQSSGRPLSQYRYLPE